MRVVLRTDPAALTVPREAVQTGQNGNFIYVIEEGVAKLRPVTIDRVQDKDIILADGLKGGETVVIEGALLLTNNARVEVRSPAASAAPKKSAS